MICSVYPCHGQHVTAVGDEISRDAGDDPVRPFAELLVAETVEHLCGKRRAEHRGKDRQHSDHRIEVRRLVDYRAEIKKLRGVAEDLAHRLGGDDLAPIELAAEKE